MKIAGINPTDSGTPLRERIAQILSPAIDARAPYAKIMVGHIVEMLETEIAAAYERGAAWVGENPNASDYVGKAARDYADKITSPESS